MTGMVPKNYFNIVEAGKDSYDDDDWDQPASSYPNFAAPAAKKAVKVLIVHVLYSYEAQQEDELTIDEGDVLQVLDDSDPDWYLAKPVTKLGSSGLVPRNYVQLDDMSTGPWSFFSPSHLSEPSGFD